MAGTLSLSYERPRWALDLKGMFGFCAAQEKRDNTVYSVCIALVSIDARFYSAVADTSPFVALGPSLSSISEPGGLDTVAPACTGGCVSHTDGGRISGSGLGAYAEAGIMFLRRRRFPMALTLRADVPFYRLHRELAANVTPTTGS